MRDICLTAFRLTAWTSAVLNARQLKQSQKLNSQITVDIFGHKLLSSQMPAELFL